ncbi:MAG: DegT/DnrJ/EryC1/StrS family aminotransferase [Planctomycetota bacterium]
MAVPLFDLTLQHEQLRPELRRAFESVVDSGHFIMGPAVEAFETKLAEFCGVKHAIGVSSGADALTVILMALDLAPGDEVITSPMAYVHVAGAIQRAGGTPVFADINPRTFNLAPESIEGAITPKTRAILAPHLFGLSANLEAILAIAKAHGLRVIEDADQAIGARYQDRQVGAIGDAGAMSFFPTKNLAALGDAGAVLTNDDALAQRVRTMRFHGIQGDYTVHRLGGAFRLDAMQAAMLLIKLPYVEQWTARRREIAERYRKRLDDVQVTCPFEDEHRRHAFNQYTIRVRAGGREPLRHHLAACEIGCRVYYPRPLHLQPCFDHLGYEPGALPEAERACDEVLSIPIFTEMTKDQQDHVIQAIRDVFAGD